LKSLPSETRLLCSVEIIDESSLRAVFLRIGGRGNLVAPGTLNKIASSFHSSQRR
jgi:hypothetical protein